jgi:ubiquinone biosynthesis protein
VQVPRLLEPCSPRVTAMERVEGSKLDRATIPSPIERRRLADLAIEALVAQPMFSHDEEALFHGDPHAGNLFHTVDGRLALLDWSLAGRLTAAQRTVVTQIALAAATGRPRRIEALLGELALDDAYDRQGLQAAVARALAAVRGGQLPGFTWIVALLDDAVHAGRLRLPADLILYRKCLLTLAGVAEDLAGEPGRADAVLQREFLRHFAAEWPWRWLRDPFSRDSATRLSNSDLVGASFDLVSATLQLWLGPWSLWRGGSRPAARPPH